MIEDTIARIEARLKNSSNLSAEQRNELLALLSTLKGELASLSQTNAEQAHRISGFVEASAHEVARDDHQPQVLQQAVDGLSRSVLGMEIRHPKLTDAVNSICTVLSNAGI